MTSAGQRIQRTVTRVGLWLGTLIFSFIVTTVVATQHAAHADALASVDGTSGVGEGILISYLLIWPGIAIFLMLLADGMYEERRFSARLFAQSSLGGVLPVLMNYAFVVAISRLPYPANSYAVVTAVVVAVVFPIIVFTMGIVEHWPFSHWSRKAHARQNSA